MFGLMFVSKTTMGCFWSFGIPKGIILHNLTVITTVKIIVMLIRFFQVIFYPDMLNFYSTIQGLIYEFPFFNF